MRFFFAIFLPPLAVLSTGRIIATFLNVVLIIFGFLSFGLGWVLAIIHAILVVNRHYADRRMERLIAVAAHRQTR